MLKRLRPLSHDGSIDALQASDGRCNTSTPARSYQGPIKCVFGSFVEGLAMNQRKLAYIIKDQEPLVMGAHETVQHACQCMSERRAGSVLVVDEQQRLTGIFTGRDAVRTLAEGKEAAATVLAH